MGINQAAREGARAAAVGAPPDIVTLRIIGAAPAIDGSALQTQYEFRSLDEASGTWSAWQPLGVDGPENNARRGDQIRVTVRYPHQLITGGLFAGLADEPGSGTITLHTSIVIQRE